MNKNYNRLSEPNGKLYLLVLLLFAVVTFVLGFYELAVAEAAVVVALIIYSVWFRKKYQRRLESYIQSVIYDTENATSNTLVHFPLPIAVFRFKDAGIVWGNDMFFGMFEHGTERVNKRITDLIPEFSPKWLKEGKAKYPSLIVLNGKKYQVHGNIIRTDETDDNSDGTYLGITYWVDVTDYDDIKCEYFATRPVAAVIVIDNLDELFKYQPDRTKNDLRDSIEDFLKFWAERYHGVLRRYDRDRYIAFFEERDFAEMKASKFEIIEKMHQVQSPSGVEASISIGFGEKGTDFREILSFADLSTELALTRGGDQVVIKNRTSYEFFGGRGDEVEKRTKVKSRVIANTLSELIRDSSRVFVMGHRFADLDAVGAAVGICALARRLGVSYNIVIDVNNNASKSLLDVLKEKPEYSEALLAPQDAVLKADGRTLLVVVDTNRPEQLESLDLLEACNRIAVIDHHRAAATYIQNADLGFVEPSASSTCELVTEILQEVMDEGDVLKYEADSVLSGIYLDTKNFTLRTGDRTFDAAAYLRRAGADTTSIKRLFQSDMEETIEKYRIMQNVTLYKDIAVALSYEATTRTTAAKAADELLNISGVNTSVVLAPDGKGNSVVSARSIGDINVQILMEKLGGGGNRSAAAAQIPGVGIDETLERVHSAIDEYIS